LINCKKCNFIINGNLKHSIDSNTCPSCGSPLLDNLFLREVSKTSKELLHNGFNLESHQLKILAIFIVNKIDRLSDVHIKEQLPSEESMSFSEDINEEPELSSEFDENSFMEDAKKEIENDLGITNLSEPIEEDDDEDRVSRLRELAKHNPVLNKRGAAVRRVGD